MGKQVVGLAPWSPNEDSLRLIEQVEAVIEENTEFLPLTARQIFYRLVGAHGYDKTELAYARLLEKLNRARRSGMVDFDAIRDDRVTEVSEDGWDSPEQWVRAVVKHAKEYRRDRQLGQSKRLELWVEAAGMVPQAVRVAERYGVPVYSSGGFNSTTMKWEAACRFIKEHRANAWGTLVLHVGDHDPSGVAIFENLHDDVPQLVADALRSDTGFDISRWRRVAVTPEQIERYDLEEAPAKTSDSRSVTWKGGTVQVEAMSPRQIANEIRAAIEAERDLKLLEELIEEEREERDRLVERLEEMVSNDG